MHKQIESLSQKQMTRKEFLATLGFGVASLMGFSSIIKLLQGDKTSSHARSSSGYGSSSYGR